MANTSIPTTNDHDEIVTINAGGKIFQILKSTLCLPPKDTAWCKLFNGGTRPTNTSRTTSSHNIVVDTRDSNGNVFLDFDSELIEIVLNFLRMKKIEDPFDPIVEPPSVPRSKSKDLKRILNHFGLTAFFYYPSTIPASTLGTNTILPIHHIRKMSLGSHDDEHSHNLVKHHDSLSFGTPEDASIAEGFEYCYG